MKRPTSTDAVTSPNVPVAPSSLDPMSTTTHGGTQGPGPTSEGDTGGSDSSSTVVILVVVLLALFVVALILGIFIFRRRKDLKETKFGGIRSMLSSWFRHVTCRGRRSSEGDIYDNDLTFPRLPEEPVSNTRLSIIPRANFVCLGESQPPQQDTYSTDNALDNRRSGVFHDSEEVYDDALIYNPYDIVYDNVIRDEGVNSVTGDTKSRKPSKLSGDSSSPAKSLPSPEKIIEEKDQQNSNPTASPVIYEKKQLRPTSGTAADSCHDETGVTVKPGDGEERLTIKNDLYQFHQEMLDEELTRIRMDKSRKFHSSPADHSPKPQREPDTNSSTILRQPKDVESGTALGSRHPKDTQPETAPVRGRETTEHRVQDSSKTSSIDNANDPSKHEHSIKIRKKKRQPKDNSSHDSHTQSVKPNKSSKQQPHHQEQAHLSQEEQQFFHELGISTDATEQPESMSLRDKKESSNHSFESKAPTSKKEIDSQAKSVHVEEPRLTKSTNSIKDGHTESSPVARKLLHGTKRESDSRPKKGASHSAPAKSDNKTGKKPAKPELVSNIIQMSLDGIKEKRRAESPNVNSEISDDKAEAIGNESSNF
ncbi:uncharacterized protein LOC101860910 [Aplysia californica]|uniref:Uncharacterized protein LOC101860910 n=1 Tax=Aplysia californica TaxID=6500 RepID=A0ABM0JXX0_APLCA|nr:uncharacterized protein LOC101860910 [Aplysia californica]